VASDSASIGSGGTTVIQSISRSGRAGLDGGATLLPVLLTLCGGLGWALGNLCNRQARPARPFRLMLWMTVVPPVPLLALSLATEGPARIGTSLVTLGTQRGLLALAGLLFTVVVATLLGSGIWTALMSRHPSGTVAPFSMLVPVVGTASSWLFFGERTPAVEVACGVLVVAGVLYGSRPPRAYPAAEGTPAPVTRSAAA